MGSTATAKALEDFTKQVGGRKFSVLFDLLQAAGLHPLGKSNTGTLLFQYIADSGQVHNVLAFRRDPAVLSFPVSFWQDRKDQRLKLCDAFQPSELLSPLKGVGSQSNNSAGQIAVSKETLERLQDLCKALCDSLENLRQY